VTLTTIERVRREFGVNINLGASNVSFGLPDRHTVNQAFLALGAGAGASCVITNPEKLTAIIRASDLLLGRDAFAARHQGSQAAGVGLGMSCAKLAGLMRCHQCGQGADASYASADPGW
jgi:hypothetical protein